MICMVSDWFITNEGRECSSDFTGHLLDVELKGSPDKIIRRVTLFCER